MCTENQREFNIIELINGKRFSFTYGGRDLFSLPLKTNVTEKENEAVYEYITEDGLKITNICKRYGKYNAVEWVSWLENTSDAESKILSEIHDCDIILPFPDDGERPRSAYVPSPDDCLRVYAPDGSDWKKDEFYSDADEYVYNFRNHLYNGESKEYKCSGGRSSDGKAPFFNIFRQNSGVILGIGWSGQWKVTLSKDKAGLSIKAGIEDACFKLLPKEKIRTASMVIMGYTGTLFESQNKWRRLIKEHFSLIGSEGRDKVGPLCAGVWGGMSTKGVIERIELYKKNNIPVEYIWMDAGWYGTSEKESPDEFLGDWASYTGDWRVNKTHHPDELAEVSRAISEAGYKFILWFEPERVIMGTPITKEHPEYFLYPETGRNCLLNLGDEKAFNYCLETLSGFIERLNIKFYRQDFNFAPLSYWRNNDTEERRGITEIKHIMGLYRLWDTLLERFPELCIDNCASGGRRIDMETMRRSMPLWRSDAQCPANYPVEFSQSHNIQYGYWMPYSGTGSGRDIYDTYRIRSAYGGSLTTNYVYSERDKLPSGEELEWIRKYMQEYLSIRKYFYMDMYPLTDSLESLYSWNAVQYDSPEDGEGMVQAFRHEKSPFKDATFNLYNIKTDKKYRITDLDDGSFVEISGDRLSADGFDVCIPTKKTAKIFIYKQI